MERVYNSFGDISKASEQDAKKLISEASAFLGDFISDARAQDEKIGESMVNIAANTAAGLRWPSTRAGLPSQSAALQTNEVLQQAQLQKAQQTSLTDQRIAEAAAQFLNTKADISSTNMANQLNAQQLAATYGPSRGSIQWSNTTGSTKTEKPDWGDLDYVNDIRIFEIETIEKIEKQKGDSISEKELQALIDAARLAGQEWTAKSFEWIYKKTFS